MTSSDGEPRRVEKVTLDRINYEIGRLRHEFIGAALARVSALREWHEKAVASTHYLAGRDGKVVTHPETGEPVEDVGPRQRSLIEMRHLIAEEVRLLDLYGAWETTVKVCSPDGTVLAVVRVQAPPAAVTVERPDGKA